MENNFRVLIAACDTFRAGAVEQLRTHMHHLNALHPPERHNGQVMVQLFEQVCVSVFVCVNPLMHPANYSLDIITFVPSPSVFFS